MTVTVEVDAQQALAKFSPAGIPEAVRRNLRTVIPDITKRLGAQIDANLTAGLKTRRRLVVRKEMVENPNAIFGRVRVVTTAPPQLLPLWIEKGTRPHVIAAKNVQFLRFFWDKVGKVVFFRSVNHPGTKALNYSANAFAAMQGEIRSTIEDAVKKAGQQA